MTSFILCRHGRTDWNDAGRYQGQTDVPLNAEGRRQACFLAQTLRSEPIAAFYSSDLARAADTAEEMARFHHLEVRRDPRLREIHQGDWEGLTLGQILARDAELHALWQAEPETVRLPGGESVYDVRRRVVAVLAEIERDYPDGLVCVVGHQVVLTVLRCGLTGEPLAPALRVHTANAGFERVTPGRRRTG